MGTTPLQPPQSSLMTMILAVEFEGSLAPLPERSRRSVFQMNKTVKKWWIGLHVVHL